MPGDAVLGSAAADEDLFWGWCRTGCRACGGFRVPIAMGSEGYCLTGAGVFFCQLLGPGEVVFWTLHGCCLPAPALWRACRALAVMLSTFIFRVSLFRDSAVLRLLNPYPVIPDIL